MTDKKTIVRVGFSVNDTLMKTIADALGDQYILVRADAGEIEILGPPDKKTIEELTASKKHIAQLEDQVEGLYLAVKMGGNHQEELSTALAAMLSDYDAFELHKQGITFASEKMAREVLASGGSDEVKEST